MIKEAIQKIESMALQPDVKKIDGRQYFVERGKFRGVSVPIPETLALKTLTGLVDFIKDLRENETMETPLIVTVVTPGRVRVLTQVLEPWNERHNLAQAETIHEGFNFDRELTHERFVIGMQACFVRDETVAKVLKIVGNLKTEASVTTADDGVSQKATVATGVTRVEEVDLPNPITLRPYRTFLEVEQPASQYILRIGEGNRPALYTAEGGMWQLKAIAAIKEWLAAELAGVSKISIVA